MGRRLGNTGGEYGCDAQTRDGRPLRDRQTDLRGFWHRMAWLKVGLGVHAPRFFCPALLWEQDRWILGHLPCSHQKRERHTDRLQPSMRNGPMMIISASCTATNHGKWVLLTQPLSLSWISHANDTEWYYAYSVHWSLRLFNYREPFFACLCLGLRARHAGWTLGCWCYPLARPSMIIGPQGLGAGPGWFKSINYRAWYDCAHCRALI